MDFRKKKNGPLPILSDSEKRIRREDGMELLFSLLRARPHLVTCPPPDVS